MDTHKERFSVRWSVLTWVVTAAVVIILTIVAVVIWWAVVHGGSRVRLPPGWAIFVTRLAVAVSVMPALFAPLGYEVSAEAVIIRRLVECGHPV